MLGVPCPGLRSGASDPSPPAGEWRRRGGVWLSDIWLSVAWGTRGLRGAGPGGEGG